MNDDSSKFLNLVSFENYSPFRRQRLGMNSKVSAQTPGLHGILIITKYSTPEHDQSYV